MVKLNLPDQAQTKIYLGQDPNFAPQMQTQKKKNRTQNTVNQQSSLKFEEIQDT